MYFQEPQMREIIYPSFCNCLNFFNMIVSIYIHFPANSIILFYCVYKPLSLHSSLMDMKFISIVQL